MGGKEHEPAPAWNRRAEKRKKNHEGPQAGTPAPLEACATKTIMQAALEAGAASPRERLDAALEDFGRALVEVAGSIGRAWEIIREMKGELLAVEEQGHGEPTETDGHH